MEINNTYYNQHYLSAVLELLWLVNFAILLLSVRIYNKVCGNMSVHEIDRKIKCTTR